MPRQHTFSLPHVAEDSSVVHWQYRATLMPPMRAHDLLRRVTPAIAGRVAQTVANRGDESIHTELLGQFVAAIGDIGEEDHNKVVSALLQGVQVRVSDTAPWANLWNSAAPFDKGLMFEIELDELYGVLREVGEFTYGNFISNLLQSFRANPPVPAA